MPAVAPVARAPVTIVHKATGVTRSTTADSYGNYGFAALPIGDYDVTATASGFGTVRHTGVVISVGLPTKLDFELQLATVRQEVTVTGGAEVLNTQSAEGGRVLMPTEITSLPLSGRNFFHLVTLQTGVQLNTATGRQSFVTESPLQQPSRPTKQGSLTCRKLRKLGEYRWLL